MGTSGLEIVRFHGRYYIRYHQYDGYFEGVGAQIVGGIPTEPDEYQSWLRSMRDKHAAKESALEKDVYEIHQGLEPNYSRFRSFVTLPTEFPRLPDWAEYIYTINLDHEVFTMNFCIHWKLSNIPRQDNLWLRAIKKSIYRHRQTISSELCPEEHISSLALELSEPNWEVQHDFRVVAPKTNITEARNAFLTQVLARTLIEYQRDIIRFGGEWSPGSFPFRELAFALVSIASGQVEYHSFPPRECNPRSCPGWICNIEHVGRLPGWLDEKWAGSKAPLLEFGSMSHRPGEPPGASPTDTMYWLGNVVVSLTLVVDGEAINKAANWGIEQGRANFQIVVLSLFEAAFAEVTFGDTVEPFVRISYPVDLSPMRAEYCLSTHPRNRPELKPGMKPQYRPDQIIMNSNCTGTTRRLRSHFPGLAALVNFFEVATNRRTVWTSTGILPPELYDRILDFVDYDTWKTCLLVSTVIRACGLRKYRLDDRMSIVGGPFVRLGEYREERLMSFNFENIQTGKVIPMVEDHHAREVKECNWMPIIGSNSNRKAIMLDLFIQFESAEDLPVGADSDDDCA